MDKNVSKLFSLFGIIDTKILVKFEHVVMLKAFPIHEQNVQKVFLICEEYVYELSLLLNRASAKYKQQHHSRYSFEFHFSRYAATKMQTLMEGVVQQTYATYYKISLTIGCTQITGRQMGRFLIIKCTRRNERDNLIRLQPILFMIINTWFEAGFRIEICREANQQITCMDNSQHLERRKTSGPRFTDHDATATDNYSTERATSLTSKSESFTTNGKKRKFQTSSPQSPISTRSFGACNLTCSRVVDFFDEQKTMINDEVIVVGQVINLKEQNTQNRKTKQPLYILDFLITDDYIHTVICNWLLPTNDAFINEAQKIRERDWIRITGKKIFNQFRNQFIMKTTNCKILDVCEDQIYSNVLDINDLSATKRIELHCHTKMSAFDGVNSARECLEYARYGLNHNAIAITDRNGCQGFIEAYATAQHMKQQGKPLQLIYGVDFSLLSVNKRVVIREDVESSLNNVIFFDLETTGLFARFHEIIEIGAIEGFVKDENEPRLFNKYIKISNSIPPYIKKITGITDRKLTECGENEEAVIREFAKFIDGRAIVAHNAIFDNSFLEKYFHKYGITVKYTLLDSLDFARFLYPKKKSYRLARLAKFKNISFDPQCSHEAVYDAKILGLLWKKMINDLSTIDQTITTVEQLKETIQSHITNAPRDIHLYRYSFTQNILCLARNQQAIFALYRLITTAATRYFYQHESISIEELIKNRRDLFLISPGATSKFVDDLLTNVTDTKIIADLAQYDFVEINPPSSYVHFIEDQKLTLANIHALIRLQIKFAKAAGKKVYASGDVFYLHPNHKRARDVLINAKQIKGRRHPLYSYTNNCRMNPNNHLRSTENLIREFNFLNDDLGVRKMVVDNTIFIAKKIKKNVFPITQGLHKPIHKNTETLLRVNTYIRAHEMFGTVIPPLVSKRIKEELDVIITSGYDIIYWTCHKLVEYVTSKKHFVGSRGSVGSSLVAFLNDITEVNPLSPYYLCKSCHNFVAGPNEFVDCGADLPVRNCQKCEIPFTTGGFNIPFEVFLGINGEKVPDIDLNFDSEYQIKAHEYLYKFYGKDNCFRAGTISTIKQNLAYGYVKYFEEELQLNITPNEISLLCVLCSGVKRTSGQHPGGIIVLPTNMQIDLFTPVNYPGNDFTSEIFTTHFSFESLHNHLLKFDILGHDDPKVIKFLVDLTHKNVAEISYTDEKVLQLFQITNVLKFVNSNAKPRVSTLGIPEFGTKFVIRLLTDVKPKSFSDLVRVSGLSHGTNVWINNFQSLMPKYNLKFKEIIACRDDIMLFLVRHKIAWKDAFSIMEDVRRGKKLTARFLNLMGKHEIPSWFIEACLKISYIFPKAHASAYVISAWRIAWFKVYQPLAFYSAIFSIKCTVFDYDLMLMSAEDVGKFIRAKEKSRLTITPKEKNLLVTLRIVEEFKLRGFDFSRVNLYKSAANAFLICNSERKLLIPFEAITGLGHEISKTIVAARKEKNFVSFADLKKRTRINKNHAKYFDNIF